MLIFRDKEILSVAKSAFIENADFISTQKWCKNRLCNGILFKKKDVFFEKIGIPKTEINTGKLKRTYDILSRGNLFDSFSLLGEYSQKLTLREKSTIGTMLAPKHCPLADVKIFENLSFDFSERDFFFYAAQCKFLAERLNKSCFYTPLGSNWSVSGVDICIRHLFK